MSDTLGARILDAAREHARLWSEPAGAGGLVDFGDSWLALRALAARADAAERLAVAVDVLDRDDWREVDADGVPLVANEHDNALAAWRAIEREVQP